MLYSVTEISELIGLSRQSIYKKLKAKELQPHISHKKGIVYVDEVGFNLIKGMLKEYIDSVNDLNNKDTSNVLNEEVSADTESLSIDKEMFNLLKEQLKENKLQLSEKDQQIKELHKLLENSQVLQLRQPQQDIKALEAHFEEFDSKLLDIKEQMQVRKTQQEQEQKGFFKKFFKK